MKQTHIFILLLLFISLVTPHNSLAEEYSRWELPEGAKFRKSTIKNRSS